MSEIKGYELGQLYDWANSAHYNMGKAGYGYGFTCVQHPRVSFVDRVFKPSREHPDGKQTRTWYVDGIEVASLEAAAEATKIPPTLTDDEQRILAFVPDDFTPTRELETELAGVPHPKGAIMPDTPHARVLDWLRSLRAKGMVEYGCAPAPDGRTFAGAVVTIPTIRKRQQERAP